MAELLKNNYNLEFVERLGRIVTQSYKSFNHKGFVASVIDKNWEARELKDRMRHITICLGLYLPDDYKKSINILNEVAPQFGGFEGMLFPDFIEVFGQDKKNWTTSLKALEEFTKYSSSEFAVRPFILKDPERVMKLMLKWSKSKNYHVRRLASEGCRSRLPWAMALPPFKKDPALILPILENLKEDKEDYVYRSVANNLNDISKDNPAVVLKICKKWKKINTETVNWTVKHALRTLLKKGDKQALELFGYKGLSLKPSLKLKRKSVQIGDDIHFSLDFDLKKSSKVRVEYVIHYLKGNGTHTKKVFKWTEKDMPKGSHTLNKKQSFRLISTRRFHIGQHFLSVQVNGKEYEELSFKLTEKK